MVLSSGWPPFDVLPWRKFRPSKLFKLNFSYFKDKGYKKPSHRTKKFNLMLSSFYEKYDTIHRYHIKKLHMVYNSIIHKYYYIYQFLISLEKHPVAFYILWALLWTSWVRPVVLGLSGALGDLGAGISDRGLYLPS